VEAKAIAGAIYNNATLNVLDLSHNSITDDGAMALDNSLRYQPSLEYLYHFSNPILKDEAWDFLKYNENLVASSIHHQNDAIMPTIFEYNDTLHYFQSSSRKCL
jgi:Leucine Rich repeat